MHDALHINSSCLLLTKPEFTHSIVLMVDMVGVFLLYTKPASGTHNSYDGTSRFIQGIYTYTSLYNKYKEFQYGI